MFDKSCYVFPAIAQLELEKRRSGAFRKHEYEAVFKKAKTTVPELRKSERSMKQMRILSEFRDPHRSLFNDLPEKVLPLFLQAINFEDTAIFPLITFPSKIFFFSQATFSKDSLSLTY